MKCEISISSITSFGEPKKGAKNSLLFEEKKKLGVINVLIVNKSISTFLIDLNYSCFILRNY